MKNILDRMHHNECMLIPKALVDCLHRLTCPPLGNEKRVNIPGMKHDHLRHPTCRLVGEWKGGLN
jgi:hypothetical protein